MISGSGLGGAAIDEIILNKLLVIPPFGFLVLNLPDQAAMADINPLINPDRFGCVDLKDLFGAVTAAGRADVRRGGFDILANVGNSGQRRGVTFRFSGLGLLLSAELFRSFGTARFLRW